MATKPRMYMRGSARYVAGMPVCLLTFHTYRSWPEDHRNGYVQRGRGLQAPDRERARWRAKHAGDEPFQFSTDDQLLVVEVVLEVAAERAVRLHALATTPTHAHVLMSFRSPACTCGASAHCRRGCDSRAAVEQIAARLKRKCGQQLAKRYGTSGRPYLSRGWDLTPVRDRAHFERLVANYLPGHVAQQGQFHRW